MHYNIGKQWSWELALESGIWMKTLWGVHKSALEEEIHFDFDM